MDVVRHQPNQGWIEVIVGSMFSGKSEELIRRLRRAQIARQRVQIFKPAIDMRYAADQIVSHSEMRIPSHAARTARELLEAVETETEVVGIDEGQFFDLELPPTVDLVVKETVPGIKGATASNQIKPATLETGMVVNVPPFINTGDIVRVNTETGEYLSRA